MNIIIAGCGKVGSTLAEQLSREGHDITVIDQRADVVKHVTDTADVRGVAGNGASYNIQKEAGIGEADLLIAVTDADEVNLLCCLIAKKAGGCKTIARVRNPIYHQEIGHIKGELGLSMVINPEFAASSEIARLLRFPSAIEINTFAKGRIELLRFRVEAGSLLDGRKLKDITELTQCETLVCIVERKGEIIIPDGEVCLQTDDTISIVASPLNASRFFKLMGVQTNQVKNTMIIGGSKTAYYLTRRLTAMGIKVKIIEKNMARCEELCELLPQAMIICGDGTDEELMEEEGLKDAEGFVSLTDMDEENIMLSLYAKSVSRAKKITKVNHNTYDAVIDTLDIGSVVNPKRITAESILQYVRAMQNSIGSNVETLYHLADGRAEALEFIIREDGEVTDVPLQDLSLKPHLLICAVNRKGRMILPRGQDFLQKGDSVVVITTRCGELKDIRDVLAGQGSGYGR